MQAPRNRCCSTHPAALASQKHCWRTLRITLIGSCLALIAGCGIESQPQAPTQPLLTDSQALMNTWAQLAAEDSRQWDIESAVTIAQRLSQTPEGLDPLLDVIEDPDERPHTKVFALISIQPYLEPEMTPRLVAMTAPEHEGTTRAVATHLLGWLDEPAAQARVRELIEDPEHRIRAAAILVLARQGDEDAVAMLPALWQDPEVRDEDKDEILLIAPEEQVREYQDLYKSGLLNHKLVTTAREDLATKLGRVGDERVLDALEEAAENDPAQTVRVLARGALEAVRERMAAEPAPEEEAVEE